MNEITKLLIKLEVPHYSWFDIIDKELPEGINSVYACTPELEKAVSLDPDAYISGDSIRDKIFFLAKTEYDAENEAEIISAWTGQIFTSLTDRFPEAFDEFKKHFREMSAIKAWCLPSNKTGIRSHKVQVGSTRYKEFANYNTHDIQSLVTKGLWPEWATHIAYNNSPTRNLRKYFPVRMAEINGTTVPIQHAMYSDIRAIPESHPDYETFEEECVRSKLRAMNLIRVHDATSILLVSQFLEHANNRRGS